MKARSEVRLAETLRHLVEQRYRNNQGALAKEVHVSPSALSQYINNRASPSLPVLVCLAEALGVTLDYLVFGVEPSPPPPDYGLVVAHMEASLTRFEGRSGAIKDLVHKVGLSLANRIEETARTLLLDAEAVSGVLTISELVSVEEFSSLTRIARLDLGLEVVMLLEDAAIHDAAVGPFGPVVIRNLEAGRRYEYILPVGDEGTQQALMLRSVILRHGTASAEAVDTCLTFFQVSDSKQFLVPGYVIYELDQQSLKKKEPTIYDKVADYINDDHHIALALPPNRQFRAFALIPAAQCDRLIRAFNLTKKAGHRMNMPSRPWEM